MDPDLVNNELSFQPSSEEESARLPSFDGTGYSGPEGSGPSATPAKTPSERLPSHSAPHQAPFLPSRRGKKRDETSPKPMKPERQEDIPARSSAVSQLSESAGEGAQEGQGERGAVPKVTAPRKARKRSRKKKVSGEVPASEDVQPEVPEPRDRKPVVRDFGFGICRGDLTEGLPVSTGPVAGEVWPVAAVREIPSQASDPAPSPLACIETQVTALLGTRPPSVPVAVNKPVPAPCFPSVHKMWRREHCEPLIRAPGSGCWNCQGGGHRFTRCPFPRGIFCCACGAPAVSLSQCPRCSAAWRRGERGPHLPYNQEPSPPQVVAPPWEADRSRGLPQPAMVAPESAVPFPAPTSTGEPHARLDADHLLIQAIAEAILRRL